VDDPHGRASLLLLGDPGRVTGGNLYDQRLVEAAPGYGIDLTVVSYPDRPFPLPALSTRVVLTKVRAGRPDVVVVDSIVAAYLGPWLATRAALDAARRARGRRPFGSVPIVALAHQPPGGMDVGAARRRLQRAADLALYRSADAVVAVSEAVADAISAGGVAPERIRLAPPGVGQPGPTEPPVTTEPPDPGLAAPPLTALCVANWLPRKGIVEVLDAVARLPDGLVTLHLVGDDAADPGYTRRVRARLRDRRLRARVVVHGVRPAADVARLYRSAHLFVLASTVEPYGMVYAEALSAGLPVVGWRAGNLPNLVTHRIDGLLATAGRVDELAGALREIATDRELLARLSAGARRRATTLPAWSHTTDVFFACLRSVMAEAAARSGSAAPSRPTAMSEPAGRSVPGRGRPAGP
jgi:glycosyltransferase involved in cell wall biosynthesis